MKTFRNTLLIIMLMGIIFIAMGNNYSSDRYKKLVSIDHDANLSALLDKSNANEELNIEDSLDDGLLLTSKEDYLNNIEYTNLLSGLVQYTNVANRKYVKVLGVDISDIFDDYYDAESYNNYVSPKEYYDPKNINCLDISWTDGDIYIESTDSAEIEVYEITNIDYQELDSNKKFTVQLIDNELKISFDNITNNIITFNQNNNKNLVVRLPQSYQKNIQIEGVACDISIHDIAISDLNVNNVSGYVDLNNIQATKTDVYTVSGNIYLNESVIRKIAIESVSGSINSELLGDYKILVASTSGDINVDCDNTVDSPNTYSGKTVSGDINVY